MKKHPYYQNGENSNELKTGTVIVLLLSILFGSFMLLLFLVWLIEQLGWWLLIAGAVMVMIWSVYIIIKDRHYE
jgi:1,4-dihydroxy-2-naphthoate octaprenyltransferase